jgi:hypothetical protein
MNDRDMRMINLYHRVCNQNNTTGVTSETGTVHPSGAPRFSPDPVLVVEEAAVPGVNQRSWANNW